MIEINVEVDDVIQSYSFPTNWSEVSVQQFSNLYGIDKEKYTGMFYTFEVIHQLTGIDRDVIEMMDYHDFVELVKSLNFVFQPVEDKKNESIIIDGEEYFVHTNFNKYTAGEIISLETIIGSSNGEFVSVMPQLLCIFLRKKKENGKLETFKGEFMERATLFRKTPVSQIYNIFNFFLVGGNLLEVNTKDFSEK